jgi:hypothetical protein
MNAPSFPEVEITGGYWLPRLQVNAQVAIFHQWQQLEKSGCIDNFRLLAGHIEGFRQGWFFADSDAYKWLDAAARIYDRFPSERLKGLMDDLIGLIAAAQSEDGYLFTYNQIHFPQVRWANLQIEHELYCHGHLIEAGVSHYQATGQRSLLDLTIKAADLLVKDFLGAGPQHTPGHQEIEIALLRLYEATGKAAYLELARHFLEQRGRAKFFPALILRQNQQVARRRAWVEQEREAYARGHPAYQSPTLPPGNPSRKPPFIQARFMLSGLSGKYMQQHRPIRAQATPVGHAVRYAYLQSATARLARLGGDRTLLPALIRSWDHMVQKRMYLTGGIGALPALEGFGRDYELDPEYAYAETCAALGCMFWSWEMTQITAQAQYADLFEWQLYNAAGVGMGLDGDTYLYNNPLACRGGVVRQSWYEVPCCPSNLSRTWASLDAYLLTHTADQVWLHQYLTSRASLPMDPPLSMQVESGLPYRGEVGIGIHLEAPVEFTLHLRVPGWAAGCQAWINGEPIETPMRPPARHTTASGYSPYAAFYMPLRRLWTPGDRVDLAFDMPILLRETHPRLRSTRGRVALTRGPLVYCLESLDNTGIDIHTASIDTRALASQARPDLLGGAWTIEGRTTSRQPFVAIPYHLWANRGLSEMTVYVRAGSS